MSDIGLVEGDVCNREGCKGVMREQETDTCCSCHINAPCSHCVDAIYECFECGEETDPPETGWVDTKPIVIPKRRTNLEIFNNLKDDEFGYVTIAGKYYWMEYWGKAPATMTGEGILRKFNVCFGYQWIKRPKNGVFHIKVYTD